MEDVLGVYMKEETKLELLHPLWLFTDSIAIFLQVSYDAFGAIF